MATTPTSASNLFDEILPPRIDGNQDKAKEIGAVYGFKISGDGGGEWTVDLTAPSVSKGLAGNVQCTLEVAHSDFMSMLNNPAMGMQLFMQGKLKVVGDPMLAMKLQKLFSLGG